LQEWAQVLAPQAVAKWKNPRLNRMEGPLKKSGLRHPSQVVFHSHPAEWFFNELSLMALLPQDGELTLLRIRV
jgi:hypothetical protein